jgi:kynurenine formamidase
MSDGEQEISDEQWRDWFRTLSNWGRWGPDDQRGTLNLIDSAKVAAAARLVSEGRQVPCGRVVEFGNRVSVYEADAAPLHFMSSTGARLNADGAGGGLDWVGFHAGVSSLEEGHGIGPDELDAAAAAHGVEPEAGDVVLVRTGYGAVRERYRRRVPDVAAAPGADPTSVPHLPGLAESTLPWFRAHDIAVVGTDTGTERRPPSQDWIAPFHVVAMCAMGMWVLDNFELEALARTCRELSRWTFMIVIAPIRFKNATGSPVNPIALF